MIDCDTTFIATGTVDSPMYKTLNDGILYIMYM